MADSYPVQMRLEWTPNPNTIKYMINRILLDRGAANFASSESAEPAPLPRKLFGIAGVSGVMVGQNFVTVTKSDVADWEAVHLACSELIQKHLEADEPVLGDYQVEVAAGAASSGDEALIRRILDEEIRPAVAQDGGDITFDRYEAGVLYLHMKGACSGCPSSTMTLRMGIEARLREEIPELVEIIPV